MPDGPSFSPHVYHGVMISSTFDDLKGHRAAVISAINGDGMASVAMENDSAKLVDVIDSSLGMVRDSSAYFLVISQKYGQVPIDPVRNPRGVSLTELEFDEAVRLGRPILLFIMSEDHLLRGCDIEIDAVNRKKLDEFRNRAKKIAPDVTVDRVYAIFESKDEFALKAAQSLPALHRYLDEKTAPIPQAVTAVHAGSDPIPSPPAIYAEPPYIGSHKFVGRGHQLDILRAWAVSDEPVLLFDAIGGTGKSILTWTWTTKEARSVRGDWAGFFWYSFYERGAIMADFCRRALMYMTRNPASAFTGMKTPELAKQLLRQLRSRPWLLVLDGLERILVAYHRSDAAQLADEEADTTTDQIAARHPCEAIRWEDDQLLHSLAGAEPSKILITSRLVPRGLLNHGGQPIPGVTRVALPGLRPQDAEALFRSCGITGSPEGIQSYLTTHCDCHPLVIGVLAGLVNDYLPARGNFDTWQRDPQGGGQLDLAELDLVQIRNHILRAALNSLPEMTRQFLSTLAILSDSVDTQTMMALNPELKPRPTLAEPAIDWVIGEHQAKTSDEQYKEEQRRREYEVRLAEWQASADIARQHLTETVRDLEQRGLLQFDGSSNRYDLHPVVRSMAARGLRASQVDVYGERVVDHFSSKVINPYKNAQTLDDVRSGLQVVRTLIKMGRYDRAYKAFRDDLEDALLDNLEANAEVGALLRPFFSTGWASLPKDLEPHHGSYLANSAAIALERMDELEASLTAHMTSMMEDIRRREWRWVTISLTNISRTLAALNRLVSEDRCLELNFELAMAQGDLERIFFARQYRFAQLARMGEWEAALAEWSDLDGMGRGWARKVYLPGNVEFEYAQFCFWRGDVTVAQLDAVGELAKQGQNRRIVRRLHALRGEWHLGREEWNRAAESLGEAVAMGRSAGQTDPRTEAKLALAKLHLGEIDDPRREAEQLESAKRPSHTDLGSLWLEIGDPAKALQHAREGYAWACSDGGRFVRWYELKQARALLKDLGASEPRQASCDSEKARKFDWEDLVKAGIQELREPRRRP